MKTKKILLSAFLLLGSIFILAGCKLTAQPTSNSGAQIISFSNTELINLAKQTDPIPSTADFDALKPKNKTITIAATSQIVAKNADGSSVAIDGGKVTYAIPKGWQPRQIGSTFISYIIGSGNKNVAATLYSLPSFSIISSMADAKWASSKDAVNTYVASTKAKVLADFQRKLGGRTFDATVLSDGTNATIFMATTNNAQNLNASTLMYILNFPNQFQAATKTDYSNQVSGGYSQFLTIIQNMKIVSTPKPVNG